MGIRAIKSATALVFLLLFAVLLGIAEIKGCSIDRQSQALADKAGSAAKRSGIVITDGRVAVPLAGEYTVLAVFTVNSKDDAVLLARALRAALTPEEVEHVDLAIHYPGATKRSSRLKSGWELSP